MRAAFPFPPTLVQLSGAPVEQDAQSSRVVSTVSVAPAFGLHDR